MLNDIYPASGDGIGTPYIQNSLWISAELVRLGDVGVSCHSAGVNPTLGDLHEVLCAEAEGQTSGVLAANHAVEDPVVKVRGCLEKVRRNAGALGMF